MKAMTVLAAVSALVAIACGGAAPTAVDLPAPVAATVDDSGGVTASSGKPIPISGELAFAGQGALTIRGTPGGILHLEAPVTTRFSGDVVGDVVFTERGVVLKDPDGKVAWHAPFVGEVKWASRTGTISGQWHTVCSTVPQVTCGGTFEAKGAGGLEGVKFHFVWGPGFYPLDWTGFAIDNSR